MIRTVLIAVALLALGACTSAPPPSPTTESTPPSTPTESAGVNCEDAPEDVVGAVLQLRLNHPRQTITDNVVRCSYDGGMTEVRFETGADAASFAEGRKDHAQIADLPDFHDEAYRATAVTGEVIQTAVVARAGTVEITVTSGAHADQAQQLITTLFTRL
ncbi:hypothetical protein ALI22I_28280 [Saccharothrix sp. ALI-22-I]|uniref:hypothetical protein n=1 Tax=Saccharothrix sp. ALI-22-I TaxID=1933778 RepID=UPI00097BAB0A|nr:hypothetical protein [Saccharothrix sp. ALI-22-I]ONI85667.1 hypothetical protein ALI22I_28280 [Saccharothrix sp. ALI-22-I]